MATAELKTLHDELNMLLKTVPGKAVSASKVQAVAKACFHARGEYKRAVYAVEQFIKKAPAHCRLAGVYAIDAVCRRSKAQLKDKDPFVASFWEGDRWYFAVPRCVIFGRSDNDS